MAEHRSNDEDDPDLLQALQSGDVDGVFQELYRRYRRRVLAIFAKRGFDPESCRDLSQETFFRVYRGRRSFRGDVPIRSWIFQIAVNVANNEFRRRRTDKRRGLEKPLDDAEESQPVEIHTGGNPSPAAVVAPPLGRTLAREQVAALGAALEELPPKMRRTMQLATYHEYGTKEIAAVMKVTESTVKVQLHQARKRLRQALVDRFGDLPF